ncbi:ribonuclease H-like domain-containing protein [Tanacetum coccineum]
MIEPKKPLKKKDQILMDEDIAQRLQEEMQAELEEEERMARQKEDDNLISWDNTQAMMETDYVLAQRLQVEEHGELTNKERSKLFVELMDKRKKHFEKLRAKEIRRKPPTKAQKRNQICTYLKNMDNYKHSQLKNKCCEEIQMLFYNTMKWADSFVPMDSEVVEGSKSQAEGSKKRTREELESDNSKKQKIDENVEAKVDDEAEMKKHMEIVHDDEVAIDAIPLATKPPIIVDWKIIKEGNMGYFQIIRADGSSRRPEEAYERVLWGDLKVMFEPDIESEVWRNLQGYNVTVWKIFSSSGVHFVRFQNPHIFMLGEYDMWRLRIEQYFQVQVYALWDVIENGNSFKPAAQTITNADGTSTTLIPGLVTTEEKVQKKNDVKARSMFLMTLPNEHLMTFNQYKDTKTLFAAIQTRFGESLDSIFNRLQKIVSQLAILGENISQKDLNLKFLRSLPSEWNTHVVVWRNKPDLDTMSFDDLYNNLKIVEQAVKGAASSSSSSSSQNMAFVSSPSSTNDVNTAYGVSTANTQVSLASTQVSTASTQVNTANLCDDTIYKTGKKITINGSDTVSYDKSRVECFNCHKMGYFARECRGPRNQDSRNMNQDSSRRTVNVEETSSKSMVAIDGAATYKRGLASIEDQLVFYKKNEVILYEQLAVLKRDISYKDSEISMLKRSRITNKSRKGVGFVNYNVVPPPPTSLFSPLKFDLSNFGLEEFQQPEFEGYGPKTSKSVSEDISNEVRESLDAPLVKELVLDDKFEKKTVFPTFAKIEFVRPKQQDKLVRKLVKYAEMLTTITIKRKGWNMVPRAVLMKTGLRSLNTARPVNTAHPKTTVYSARPMSHFYKSTQSTIKRPYQIRTTLTNKNSSQKLNTVKGKFYTAGPKAVNTVRPNLAVVNVVRENQVNAIKALACWV